ncbi:unnamed protein product [Porites lobata]|uniref:Uncharacterized protein n=1 Tax=Porites lobata TaxID=104759 RepID=A0ABN8NII5_9CNID|nr:unnamed protein product [Porites lobata]
MGEQYEESSNQKKDVLGPARSWRQIMTIAAMEPVQSEPGNPAPDYSQIYTLLSRVMREQPPPDLTPIDASVILDLLNDLERRLAGHDISSQVQFVVNKSKEIMATAAGTTGQGSSDAGSNSGRPKSQLFSLNPLNVPVQLLNLKKPTPVNTASKAAPETTKEQT